MYLQQELEQEAMALAEPSAETVDPSVYVVVFAFLVIFYVAVYFLKRYFN